MSPNRNYSNARHRTSRCRALQFWPVFLAWLALANPGCNPSEAGKASLERTAPSGGLLTGLPGLEALEANTALPADVSGRYYVPAYSHVHFAEQADRFELAITLSVRNTDSRRSIILRAIQYIDSSGKQVASFLSRPLKVAPLASCEVFVREGDTRGGSSTAFLVDYVADGPIEAPRMDSVMIGTVGSQGIALTLTGFPLSRLNEKSHSHPSQGDRAETPESPSPILDSGRPPGG